MHAAKHGKTLHSRKGGAEETGEYDNANGGEKTDHPAEFDEKNQLDGFWSAKPYFGFVASFKYDDEKVSLDKYTIVEEDRQRETYNWLQYFSPESLQKEVHNTGLQIDELLGDVAGKPYDTDSAEFAVVMKRY